jgi:hypothetical protein
MRSKFISLSALIISVGLATQSLAPSVSHGAATESKQDDRYTLTYSAAGAKKGESAAATVTVTPKGEWHLNREFPTSLSVTPSTGVAVTKTKLKLQDAKRFDEHKGLEFQITYEAKAAGKEKLDGKLKFAICMETSCSPVTEIFSIPIDVE